MDPSYETILKLQSELEPDPLDPDAMESLLDTFQNPYNPKVSFPVAAPVPTKEEIRQFLFRTDDLTSNLLKTTLVQRQLGQALQDVLRQHSMARTALELQFLTRAFHIAAIGTPKPFAKVPQTVAIQFLPPNAIGTTWRTAVLAYTGDKKRQPGAMPRLLMKGELKTSEEEAEWALKKKMWKFTDRAVPELMDILGKPSMREINKDVIRILKEI
ncbi:hypothetical protein CC86DRAFT_407003 [Ophiobolus disseminans]|uniref:Uncharacterized protein n=1 Tax=Ophiobolus disseminans TaxID=1469910 RepID=A0A6A6ZXG9_9PLEO|nr:hypothetical protein CC86DRAFT_407003 [Ophiobolus disseminans]